MGTPSGALLGRTLVFIEGFYDQHGYMPTCKQVGAETGVSYSHASLAIRTLWQAGDLRRIRISEHRYVYVLPRQIKGT